ncbi:hypothetical protein FL857_11810 [Criibacterium bergeronii]|uniref:Uncharacterized protein n=1 Tax=Criibacterium bergeronii TaxID=1871336 RepID=A0A552UV36_9FIRM|nr:hypothetical protein [Criibacterium bergeronii]TRW22098.1 hypothetical protein FL857_11810 [Criibacterium bergeronii]
MYIKFDEFELLELFGNEPVSIGDLEAGELIYSLSDDKGFKIVMFMNVYENVCEISIDYQELNVFTCRIEKVVSINKVNDEMIINNEEKNVLKVKFKNQIGVELL